MLVLGGEAATLSYKREVDQAEEEEPTLLPSTRDTFRWILRIHTNRNRNDSVRRDFISAERKSISQGGEQMELEDPSEGTRSDDSHRLIW